MNNSVIRVHQVDVPVHLLDSNFNMSRSYFVDLERLTLGELYEALSLVLKSVSSPSVLNVKVKHVSHELITLVESVVRYCNSEVMIRFMQGSQFDDFLLAMLCGPAGPWDGVQS